MKIIKFETTCNKTLQGCKHPNSSHKIMLVEIPAPEKAETMDQHELTSYVENLTGLFCIGYLELINKPVETTNEQPNLEIEPEYFESLNKILCAYTEMMSDDEYNEKEYEEELALCEVLQNRMDFLG